MSVTKRRLEDVRELPTNGTSSIGSDHMSVTWHGRTG
jgi:hypothetical protein